MELDLSLSLQPSEVEKLDNESSNDVDFISKLPNEILLQFLSLLRDDNAQATSVLSKRWKDVWAFLPDLFFVMPCCANETQVKLFMDFIHRILILRDGTEIRKFSLFLESNCDYARVYDLMICAVLGCKIQAIDLRFPRERMKVKFPWNHFESLVSLTLRGEFVLDVPENVLFPSLKALTLLSVIYSCEASVLNLFSGCPVLENLHVERHLKWEDNYDNVITFTISVPSLKVLNISFVQPIFRAQNSKLMINAPNLEELCLTDHLSQEFAFETFSSIDSATFDVNHGNAINLLQSVSAARTLTLTSSIMKHLGNAQNINDAIPLFKNLVTLKIAYDECKGWKVLFPLLHKMPNLENLIFGWGLVPSQGSRYYSFMLNFSPPDDVPACLLSKLVRVVICNEEAVTGEELPLIGYLLRFGVSLETMAINHCDIDAWQELLLLGIYKGSNSCQITLL